MKIIIRSLFLFFLCLCTFPAAFSQTADFTIEPSATGCSPFAVRFEDKSSGTITSYFWDFGNTITSTLSSPSTTYLDPGTYIVKLTVRNGSGTPNTKTATITVYPSPSVSFTNTPLSGCPCTNVGFTNTSAANAPGAYTSIWSFGDGYTATTNNTSHLYCVPGSYNIALKVTNSVGCSRTRVDSGKVVIFDKPQIAFGAPRTNLCKLPDTAYFMSTISKGKAPYTYSWDFGDGTPASALANPAHTYTGVGRFTVRLTVTDANGCKDTLEKVNYITSSEMNSSFRSPASICAGVKSVRFENTSSPGPVVTKWSWSDGTAMNSLHAERDFWKGGTYSVTMIDSFGPGCKDTATNSYIVHPKPRPNFSYSPIYPCPAPADISFVNKSNGADSFLWIFGDGTTSTLKSPIHTYTWDSVFTVYLVARTPFGCLDTFRVRDTTKDFPAGYPTVRGKFSAPTFDSSNSPVIIRVRRGVLMVNIDSGAGCIPFILRPVALLCTGSQLPGNLPATPCPKPDPFTGYSYPPYWPCHYDGHPTDWYPDEFADPYIIESKTTCENANVKHPYPIVKYWWDFGDGSTSTADSPTHIYTTEGIYTVTVRVETHNGCTYRDTFSVMAGEKPLADFTAVPREICIHDSVTFTNKSLRGHGFTWRFGDGGSFSSIDSTVVFKHRFDKADTFLTVLSANRYGCIDTMGLQIIVHPPEVEQVVQYSCDTPMLVRFIDSSKGATSVHWDFGDGTTSTLRTVEHIYAAEGKYWVTQSVYNNVFNCSDTEVFQVHVFNAKAFFYTEDTTHCLGDSVVFYDSVRSYFANWFWFTADMAQKDIPKKFTVRYKDTGRYDVMYVGVDIHQCLDTFFRKSYVLIAKPQMKAVASPLIACAPSMVSFTDMSTNTAGAFNVSRKWYWGDAASSSDTPSIYARHYYPSPGPYTVKLITKDNVGCVDSTTLLVESRRPVPDFVAEIDTYTCVYRPVKFFSKSTGTELKYEWSFGDGGTSSLENPVYAYAGLGTFTVKLVVTDQTGCKDSIIKTAFVKTVKPKASFTMSDSVALCPPLFVSFTNTSSADAIRIAWDFDNGSVSTLNAPVIIFTDSGIYRIRLVAFDKYGCTDTAYKRARVLGYDGALKYTPLSGCAPLTVSFEADLVQTEIMLWDFADGITESAKGKPTTTHTYTEPGSYLPRLVLGDGKGCSTSSRGLDTIKVDGVVGVISHTPACINTEVIFNDSSYSYFSDYASSEWLFDDGFTSTDKNPRRTYSSEGTHIVKLITTNTNGCRDTVERTIRIYGLPTIKAMDTVICLNDQATLSASGGVSYSWAPHATLSCTECNNPVTSTKVSVRYYVTGTDANGCQNRDTLDVGIKLKTTIVISRDTEVCARTPITLAASGAQQYLWTPETFLSNATIATPVATMDSTIVYRVIGTEGSCIPDTGFVRVTVHPLPEVNAGPDQRVMAGTEVQLSGTGNHIKEYLWTPSASLSCSDCASPVARPEQTTTYMLKATSEHGCTATDDVIISIFCDQSQLFIPNTFTPNGDGRNDYFYPQGKGVSKIRSFIIFNRWGQKVYERQNIDANAQDQGWDGSFNGNALGPDTFVYTLEATCDNGEVVFWKGDVTLIK